MRKLTMIRKKTFVASLMSAYLFVEVQGQGEMELRGVQCAQVATIKNGQSATVSIPETAVRIFIVFDKIMPKTFNTVYDLGTGAEDVTLYTKAKYNPFKGNPFVITEN